MWQECTCHLFNASLIHLLFLALAFISFPSHFLEWTVAFLSSLNKHRYISHKEEIFALCLCQCLIMGVFLNILLIIFLLKMKDKTSFAFILILCFVLRNESLSYIAVEF